MKNNISDIPKKKITLAGLRSAFKLFRFIWPFRVQYALGMLFLLMGSGANLVFPKLLGDLVSSGNRGAAVSQINELIIILGALLIAQAVFSYFRTILFVNVTEKTLAALRQFTLNHLIKLPVTFFDQHRVGELNSRISSDISLLQETLTTTLADFIRQMVVIIGGTILLATISVKLTLFMLATLPAVMILAYVFGRFIRNYAKKAQKEVANSNTIVEETLQGIRSVKTYTNEVFESQRYLKKTEEIAQIGIKGGKYRGAFASFLVLGLFGTLAAVIWRGSLLLASGEFESGALFSFVLYSVYIGGTIGGLASVYTQIQRFIGATEDLFKIFDTEEEVLSEPDAYRQLPLLKGEIKFEQISFAYPARKNEPVLNDVNFEIRPNQMVALVGPSGAGKSTIAALLLHMYPLQNGRILFDGQDSAKLDLSYLRSQIALVPQDIFLFGGTIGENIAYGRPEAEEQEIINAARQANAWEFISKFPEGLHTVVGERGTQLSGGQRQRIAIARAILKNPRILVLDEATSSLDSESEQLVQEALEKLMRGRTSVIIAHRLSTVRKADLILVLDEGRIVEQGTHRQLLEQKNGLYRRLSRLQQTPLLATTQVA